jgi:hypothetical protein
MSELVRPQPQTSSEPGPLHALPQPPRLSPGHRVQGMEFGALPGKHCTT